MVDDSVATKKRPGWVWVISIFAFFSAGWTLLSFYLIGTGAVPLDAAREAYFSSLTGLDYGLTIFMHSAWLLGATALFLLRKFAFYLFATALGASLLITAWHAVTKGWVAAFGGPGLFGALIAFAFGVAVCLYSWRLIQRGVLT